MWRDFGGVDSEKTELPICLTHCSADTNTGDIFYYLREIQDFGWDQSQLPFYIILQLPFCL